MLQSACISEHVQGALTSPLNNPEWYRNYLSVVILFVAEKVFSFGSSMFTKQAPVACSKVKTRFLVGDGIWVAEVQDWSG